MRIEHSLSYQEVFFSMSTSFTSTSRVDRPYLWGISHLKFATTDIRRLQAFYCDILGMEYLPQYDYYNQQHELFAAMVRLKHTEQYHTLIELRYNDQQAMAQQGTDPITYNVRSLETLQRWHSWFLQNSVQCSDVQTYQRLSGWMLSAYDPDGRLVRLYCDSRQEQQREIDVLDF